MWQGVIFIGREFLEKVSKVEKVWQIAEAGIELSHSPWKECLLYEKKKKTNKHKNFEEMNICCEGLSTLLHSTEAEYFMCSWRPVNTASDSNCQYILGFDQCFHSCSWMRAFYSPEKLYSLYRAL